MKIATALRRFLRKKDVTSKTIDEVLQRSSNDPEGKRVRYARPDEPGWKLVYFEDPNGFTAWVREDDPLCLRMEALERSGPVT